MHRYGSLWHTDVDPLMLFPLMSLPAATAFNWCGFLADRTPMHMTCHHRMSSAFATRSRPGRLKEGACVV